MITNLTKIIELFLSKILENAVAVTQSDCHYFILRPELHRHDSEPLCRTHSVKQQRVCLWLKNSAMVTRKSRSTDAMSRVLTVFEGNHSYLTIIPLFSEILNREIGTGNRAHDDILDLLDLWLEKRLPTSSYSHPTEKSPIYERMLRRCTKGDYVLELFGGSGSVLATCQQMNRRCLIVELDPLFASLIILRYEKLTNTKAVKLN